MGSGTRVRSGLGTTAAEGISAPFGIVSRKENKTFSMGRKVTVFRTQVGKGFVVGVERTAPVGATEEWHHIHLYSRRGVRLDLERGKGEGRGRRATIGATINTTVAPACPKANTHRDAVPSRWPSQQSLSRR